MLLIAIHVSVALLSVCYSTYMYLKPSNGGLRVALGLMALTVGSGTALIISSPPTNLLKTCILGLLYIGFVIYITVSARIKLAAASYKIRP